MMEPPRLQHNRGLQCQHHCQRQWRHKPRTMPIQVTGPQQAADSLPQSDATRSSQSATSSESSTIPHKTMQNAEQLIWRTQTSPQCSPLTRQVLQGAEYISMGSNSSKIIALTSIAKSRTVQRDTLLPAMASEDNVEYNWWM
eukprot:1030637-Amphidinium_carterae.1